MARRVSSSGQGGGYWRGRQRPADWRRSGDRRANRYYVLACEEAYLRNRPVLPSAPFSPPPDTPRDLVHGVSRAPAIQRKTGSFAHSTRALRREKRLKTTYFWDGTEYNTCQRRKDGKDGVFTEGNNAIPIRLDSTGEKHYGVPAVLFPPLARMLLIARLSDAATIRRLAHGGTSNA